MNEATLFFGQLLVGILVGVGMYYLTYYGNEWWERESAKREEEEWNKIVENVNEHQKNNR